MTKLTVTLSLMAAFLLVSAGCSQHHRGHDPEKAVGYLSRTLDLNEQQREKLTLVMQELKTAKEAGKERRTAEKETLVRLLSHKTFDRQAALDWAEEKQKRFHEALPGIIDAYANFHESLSDAQRAKLAEMVENHQERHGGYGHW